MLPGLALTLHKTIQVIQIQINLKVKCNYSFSLVLQKAKEY